MENHEIKNKKEKKNMKRLSFITQFKNEFLLSCTGCRKVLGKMPALDGVIFKHIDKIQEPFYKS